MTPPVVESVCQAGLKALGIVPDGEANGVCRETSIEGKAEADEDRVGDSVKAAVDAGTAEEPGDLETDDEHEIVTAETNKQNATARIRTLSSPS